MALAVARAAGLGAAVEPILAKLETIGNHSGAAGAAIAAHREAMQASEEQERRAFDVDPAELVRGRIYYATDRARSGGGCRMISILASAASWNTVPPRSAFPNSIGRER